MALTDMHVNMRRGPPAMPLKLPLYCTGLNFGRTITALYSFGLTLGTIYRCGAGF
jgi:hypothetical protein